MKNETNENEFDADEPLVFDADDARLSAYALGELDGDERAEIEALLERDVNARAFVDELRAMAASLERELASEPAFELSFAQRAAIDARTRPVAKSRRWVWLGAAAAGILALGGFAYFARHDLGEGGTEFAACEPVVQTGTPIPNDPEAVQRRWRYCDVGFGLVDDSSSDSAAPASAGAAVGQSGTDAEGLAWKPAGGTAIGVGAFGLRGNAPTPLPEFRSFAASGLRSLPPGEARFTWRDTTVNRDTSMELRRSLDSASQIDLQRLRGLGYVDTDQPNDAFAWMIGRGHYDSNDNLVLENAFQLATQDPLSTFSIDVDTASYANVRRFLTNGSLPPPDAVRIEELLNYFRYDYPKADGTAPFSVSANVATCPWAPAHKLVQVGLRGLDIDLSKRPVSNLVFLVDVSGSMDEPDKLPLLVSSLKLLVQQLDGRDRLALVVYAGNSGLVLPSTTCDYKTVIANALDMLQAGGSTNGGAGIELAYAVAQQNFTKEGQNRVILCTDGDFNVGVSDEASLQKLIEEKRTSGVFLSVLGFGSGNTRDGTMELLADKGNGNYAAIDTLAEARKVLVHELGGTLVTIAKDVKIQVEFNPAQVQAWRLVGYENRVLAHQDFDDDRKDAGEIGAGHTVTALYEIVPIGVALDVPGVDSLREPTNPQPSTASLTGELLNLKLRYKLPDGDTSQLLTTPVQDAGASWQEANADFKFAAAVAGFGLVLRQSANVGKFTLLDAQNLAVQGVGEDAGGYRKEFVELVKQAQKLASSEER